MATTIDEAQRLLADELMGRPGIAGVGIGVDGERPCINVYASGPATKRVPRRFAGHPVRVIESGGFRALDGGAGEGGPGGKGGGG